MLGSMYSAVSGLSAHQMKMNVIGNNIANVNTYGFKSSRVTFSDVFYQTIGAASGPTASSGGTNPAQLGYGAMVKSIDVINTRAGSATTDRPLDVYINGEGYLPVKDSGGIIRYTRVGVLSFDVSGNLVDSSGNMVLGLALDPATGKPMMGASGTVSARDLVPIKVDPKDMDKFSGISISSKGEITAIKEGNPIVTPAANTGWLTGADITPATLYSGNITMTIERAPNIVFSASDADCGAFVSFPDDANTTGRIGLRMSDDGAGNFTYTLLYTDKAGNANTQSVTVDSTDIAVFPGQIDFNVSGKTLSVDVSNVAATGLVLNDGDEITLGHAGTPTSYLPATGINPAHVDWKDALDINGKMDISMVMDGGLRTYTLHCADKAGEPKTIASVKIAPAATSVTFDVDGIALKIALDDDPANGIKVKDDGVPVSLGHAVATTVRINARTFDKSGSEVKLATVWDATAADNKTIALGDMTLTLNAARFGSMLDADLKDSFIGSIGPGAGVPSKIANLAIVNFTNADGLSQTGEGYYVETENSGQPVGTIPGDQGTGSLRAGALEMSNVDLSREFTEMIIAQRGFQANTRMITVSDEMLSELVNMKR